MAVLKCHTHLGKARVNTRFAEMVTKCHKFGFFLEISCELKKLVPEILKNTLYVGYVNIKINGIELKGSS